MNGRPHEYTGHLSNGAHPIAVRAIPASQYSLWLEFLESGPGDSGGHYDRFSLETGDRTLTMGPCRVLHEEDPDGTPRYRLVPLESIYDFEKLWERGRVATLESAAVNLSLILSYKRHVQPEFASYVQHLTYDLSAYRALFDEIDRDIAGEPEAVRELLQAGIRRSIGSEFMEYLDRMYDRLVELHGRLHDDQIEHHGYYFRRQLWNVILTAPIMARTNLKPRGYIGDSEMMRMIYFNDYRGDTTFGQILHKHAVKQPAAQAVRNRRVDLARMLRDYLQRIERRASDSRRVRVLSVACGPAMELNEIIRSAEDCRRVHFSLLDQDKSALQEAALGIERIESRLGVSVDAEYLQESVRTLLVNRTLRERWGTFDFIYSMGLFDYLTAPVASAVLGKLNALLNPGGEMIVGNFALDNPTLPYMSFWMDWAIIHRTTDDMRELCSGLDGVSVDVQSDATGIQLFLHLKKESDNGAGA